MSDLIPSDWQELGKLIVSGEMSTKQIDKVIELHSHPVSDCQEICMKIWEDFDQNTLDLMVEHNLETLTYAQSAEIYENLEDHYCSSLSFGDQANMWRDRMYLAVDKGLISKAVFDLGNWLEYEFSEGTFSDEEIREEVHSMAMRLAVAPKSREIDLINFMEHFHNPYDFSVKIGEPSDAVWNTGSAECEGSFDTCNGCQEILIEAKSLLTKEEKSGWKKWVKIRKR